MKKITTSLIIVIASLFVGITTNAQAQSFRSINQQVAERNASTQEQHRAALAAKAEEKISYPQGFSAFNQQVAERNASTQEQHRAMLAAKSMQRQQFYGGHGFGFGSNYYGGYGMGRDYYGDGLYAHPAYWPNMDSDGFPNPWNRANLKIHEGSEEFLEKVTLHYFDGESWRDMFTANNHNNVWDPPYPVPVSNGKADLLVTLEAQNGLVQAFVLRKQLKTQAEEGYKDKPNLIDITPASFTNARELEKRGQELWYVMPDGSRQLVSFAGQQVSQNN